MFRESGNMCPQHPNAHTLIPISQLHPLLTRVVLQDKGHSLRYTSRPLGGVELPAGSKSESPAEFIRVGSRVTLCCSFCSPFLEGDKSKLGGRCARRIADPSTESSSSVSLATACRVLLSILMYSMGVTISLGVWSRRVEAGENNNEPLLVGESVLPWEQGSGKGHWNSW